MSVTLEFIIGDPVEIAAIVRNVDYDRLEEVAKRRADISLHLTPRDLDLLSREFGPASGQPPRDLGPHLNALLDEVDRGVLEVEEVWVGYASAVPEEKLAVITEQWAQRMRDEYDDPEITATEPMKTAVEDLVALCVAAKRDFAPVVHIWLA